MNQSHPAETWKQADLFEPAEIIRRTCERCRIFNPADQSPGFAGRLSAMLEDMGDRRHLIQKALTYTPGTHTFDQLVSMVLGGQLAFWALPNSFILSEIHVYPNARIYHIFLAGGVMEELLEMHRDIVPLAQALNCAKVTLAGRPGWERVMAKRGWKPHLVTLALEI